MLLEFTVGNFRSFKEPKTFSMVASSITELENNTFKPNEKVKLLKSAAIYGANASGKSNLIKAMDFMKDFVIDSSKESQQGEQIFTDRFRLSTETDDKPSFFEMLFVQNDIRYRYGFEVDEERVHSEWLFSADYKLKNTRESKLFTREFNNIEVGDKFSEGKSKTKHNETRDNSLFLSVNAQLNGEISTKIITYFKEFFHPVQDRISPGFSDEKLLDSEFKNKIMKLLDVSDIGITEVFSREFEIETKSMPSELIGYFKVRYKLSPKDEKIKVRKLFMKHKKYNDNGEFISDEEFDLDENESEGTSKLFEFSAPIIDTLEKGKVLIVDELDNSMHPNLCRMIVEMFNSKETNPNGAQLIFSTHDVTLLKNDIFRRDQIWFTEKDRYGATDLYSLVEFKFKDDKGVRKDATYDKDYIIGKYGAIPFLGSPTLIFGEENVQEGKEI